jgi:hypothetical protein
MKTWHSWNRWVIGGLVASGLAVVAFNVVLDPYSVLGTAKWLRQGYNVNERYGKIEYLRHNVGKYNAFIVGASTMGLFDPAEADRITPGRRWYNLSFLAGTPPEVLRALRFLEAQGQPITEVAYGIDIFAFRKVQKSSDAWKREHPLVTGESWATWWSNHLFASSFMEGMERITHNLNTHPRLFFDIEGTGRYYLVNWDREIEKDHQAFIDRQIYKKGNGEQKQIKPTGVVLVRERFDELAELAQWLRENGIKAHFWINPMHWKNQATIDPLSMGQFRTAVREAVGEVTDFSVRADICHNDRLFYEWQHFRPVLASQIMQEVLEDQDARGVATLATR